MPTQQERRDSERIPCKLVCPFELTKPAGADAVTLSEGYGHAINRSVRGMLLLLPENVNKRQVLEIQMPSEERKKQSTTLSSRLAHVGGMQVCVWGYGPRRARE